MLMSKYRQSGSAAKFVIIAIVLVIVTVGAIAIAVKRGEQARNDQLIAQTDKQAADKAAQDAKNAAKNAPAANPPATNNTSDTPVSNPTTSAPLPTTGPELDVVRIIAVGLLAGTATSFVTSRRGLKHTL